MCAESLFCSGAEITAHPTSHDILSHRTTENAKTNQTQLQTKSSILVQSLAANICVRKWNKQRLFRVCAPGHPSDSDKLKSRHHQEVDLISSAVGWLFANWVIFSLFFLSILLCTADTACKPSSLCRERSADTIQITILSESLQQWCFSCMRLLS